MNQPSNKSRLPSPEKYQEYLNLLIEELNRYSTRSDNFESELTRNKLFTATAIIIDFLTRLLITCPYNLTFSLPRFKTCLLFVNLSAIWPYSHSSPHIKYNQNYVNFTSPMGCQININYKLD